MSISNLETGRADCPRPLETPCPLEAACSNRGDFALCVENPPRKAMLPSGGETTAQGARLIDLERRARFGRFGFSRG
ncbi:hypothetical protein [Methylocystis heyeri]|uniref:Uncharacterized protein n=1 Tax=Methylocystis heyeri TaxID=391905 RepID=A0A6B8KCJ3_9HYPH|nr:hypothetical protein [Methylocystis heyeri]QGM44228.1 hypothetical protein H2LOC_000080 [Methylocystis heyeri]